MAETRRSRAWEGIDPTKSGYGKHAYREIDPGTINPEDYARDLRGEEKHFGDVREYNTAKNQKHPETDTSLEDLTREGTLLETDLAGHEGRWFTTGRTWSKDGSITAEVQREVTGEVRTMDAAELGVIQDSEGLYRPTRTKRLKRGRVSRT